MAWIILFTVSYILFFLFVDYKTLKANVWCGILAVILQFLTDTQAIRLTHYKINDPVLSLFGSSVLFTLGPVFVIGTLMSQFLPVKRWMLIAHPLILTAVYSIEEVLLLQVGALAYIHWDLWSSIRVNLTSLVLLSWFSMVFLKKGRYFH